MNILHYTIDLKYLFDIQDEQLIANKSAQEQREEEFKQNKKELLKYVLPLMHGIYALHNRKCNKTNTSTTGDIGLLGYSKVNIEEKLNFIVESDYYFKDNGIKFECSLFSHTFKDKIKVWLNREEKYIHTPHLGYSMIGIAIDSSIFDGTLYGESIEDELLKVAKFCAEYTEEWR